MPSPILLMRTAVSRPVLGQHKFKSFPPFEICFQYNSIRMTSILTNRVEGGIPPLVELLEFSDSKVQRAAAGALRTLAFKNDDNKNQVYIAILQLLLRFGRSMIIIVFADS